MTNPIPMDALDVWWTEHGNGPRCERLNDSPVDHALVLWNSLKELQRQERAPEGYDLDNPALIARAAKAQAAVDGAWNATHGQPVTPSGDNSGKTPIGDEPLPPKRRRRK